MAMTSAPTEPQCHRIFESGDENSENILYCIEAVTLKFLCMVFVTVFLSVCVYACGFFSECKCNMFNKYVDIEEELRYTSVATCLVFRSARSSSLFFILLFFFFSLVLMRIWSHTCSSSFMLWISAHPIHSLKLIFAWVWLAVWALSSLYSSKNHLKPSLSPTINILPHVLQLCLSFVYIFYAI